MTKGGKRDVKSCAESKPYISRCRDLRIASDRGAWRRQLVYAEPTNNPRGRSGPHAPLQLKNQADDALHVPSSRDSIHIYDLIHLNAWPSYGWSQ